MKKIKMITKSEEQLSYAIKELQKLLRENPLDFDEDDIQSSIEITRRIDRGLDYIAEKYEKLLDKKCYGKLMSAINKLCEDILCCKSVDIV